MKDTDNETNMLLKLKGQWVFFCQFFSRFFSSFVIVVLDYRTYIQPNTWNFKILSKSRRMTIGGGIKGELWSITAVKHMDE